MALDCRWHFFVNSVTAHSDIDIYFPRCECRLCQSNVTLINTASKAYDQCVQICARYYNRTVYLSDSHTLSVFNFVVL